MTKGKKRHRMDKGDRPDTVSLNKIQKQTRFNSNKVLGRNDIGHCVVCGASFKHKGVTHKVIKSAKGLRLHLCGECAENRYPTAQVYVKPSTKGMQV